MKKVYFILLLSCILGANEIRTLNELANKNTWNKNNIDKLLSLYNIKTSALTDKAYKNIAFELDKCSKRNYRRCSVNTFKLKEYSNSEISEQIDNALRDFSKQLTSHQEKIRKEKEKAEQIKKQQLRKEQIKAKNDYETKQINEVIKAGYKGIKNITELYTDLTQTKMYYKTNDYIFKANHNFEFVTLVDNFAVFVHVKNNNTPIYITVDRENKIYSPDSYILGETFIYKGIKEFQSQNGIIQTLYFKNKIFYVSN